MFLLNFIFFHSFSLLTTDHKKQKHKKTNLKIPHKTHNKKKKTMQVVVQIKILLHNKALEVICGINVYMYVWYYLCWLCSHAPVQLHTIIFVIVEILYSHMSEWAQFIKELLHKYYCKCISSGSNYMYKNVFQKYINTYKFIILFSCCQTNTICVLLYFFVFFLIFLHNYFSSS